MHAVTDSLGQFVPSQWVRCNCDPFMKDLRCVECVVNGSEQVFRPRLLYCATEERVLPGCTWHSGLHAIHLGSVTYDLSFCEPGLPLGKLDSMSHFFTGLASSLHAGPLFIKERLVRI